jgi:hypothetical protein
VINLTLQRAKELIEQAIAEKGADYEYHRTDDAQCLNWHRVGDDYVPGCIIGHVFHYLGFTHEDTGEGSASGCLDQLRSSGLIEFEELVPGFCDAIQDEQDNGASWGSAYASGQRWLELPEEEGDDE